MVEYQVEYKNVIGKDSIQSINCNYVNMKSIFCAEGEVKKLLKEINIDPYLIWKGNIKGKKVEIYEFTSKESDIVKKNRNMFSNIYFDEINVLGLNEPVNQLILNGKSTLAWKEGFEENINLIEYVDRVLMNISDYKKYSKEQICNLRHEMMLINDLANINDMSLKRFLDTYYVENIV